MTRGRFALRSLAAAALTSLVACSISARSDEFACSATSECSDGRVCVSGWCVLDGGGGGQVDGAQGPTIDASYCPPECTSCEADTCIIDCVTGNSCQGPVSCAPGMPCVVNCGGVGSCLAGVDCGEATACDVRCTKRDACLGPVECGAGPCHVVCSAADACLSGVDCEDSCACATECAADACLTPPSCPLDGACVDLNGDCSDAPDGCDACP